MYWVVLGDDDERFLRRAECEVEKILGDMGLARGADFDIAGYENLAALEAALTAEPEMCRFMLMDIEFAGESGLELTRRLRAGGQDFALVYLTNYRDYVFDCFDTKPLWYFVKPGDWEKLGALLRSDYLNAYRAARLNLKIGGRQVSIPYHRIYAAEAKSHRVRIWLDGEEIWWNGALSAIERELPGQMFIKCHNSYLINLSHMTEMGQTDVKMDNGATFPVSKRLRADALRRYFAYLKA